MGTRDTALGIVIPTLGREQLARTLLHLERQRGVDSPAFEVIVVEDVTAPAGVGAAALRGRELRARVLRAERPGASAARNVGWRATDAPLVLFLGDDILAVPGLVEAHLVEHRSHPRPEVGVLGDVVWAEELRVTTFMRWLERGIQFDFDAIDGDAASWPWLYTSNCSLKREALQAVGGFDEETFPFHYEDLDLGKRLHDALGFRLVYSRAARGEHLHPVTLEGATARIAAIAPLELRFQRRHQGFEPYFYNLFSEAAALPPARGLLARLAPWVPASVPRVGPRVWASVDRKYRQALAPAFLQAWAAAMAASPPREDR